ncbi:YggS family pyridoxal phosphate-dependent enzyme [Aureitalea marina]|uniref:Pyridoxal phosphate homeostasis protein n=1 Tax=Aureitalea marina TaxID=930804 RepID=A0A2S7KN99_9FLAO|nr:YggS family pyridoxal phosphate-dependent enzyme [Aureitalea marina]PQB04033.1 YggS family pyridoxal phosphate enzyme [Aureitalea marina]
MSSIAENIARLKKDLPPEVTLVAVSKTKPVSDLMQAYAGGQRVFGENKVQEMVSKQQEMPKDIQWHMIGHLQRNKVKYMAGFVDLVHGVDSLRLLQEIDKQAAKHQRVIDCLLQIRIAQEETKFGLPGHELDTLLESSAFKELQNVRVVGLMGMASFTSNMTQVRKEFEHLQQLYKRLNTIHNWHVLSMGMSGDYPLALECGSNMIRVGSAIFGARNYH